VERRNRPSAFATPLRFVTELRARMPEGLLSAAFWNGIATVLARGLPILGMMLAARTLGREAFGQLGIVHSTAMMLQTFAVAGLGVMATAFIARWRRAEPARAGRIVVLCYGFALVSGGLFLVGLLAGADLVAGAVLAAEGLAPALRIAGLLLLVVTVSAVQAGMLIGFEAYRAMAAANLVGGTASAVLLALGAQLGGVTGALYGLSLAFAAQVVVNHLLIRRAMHTDGIRATLRLPRAELPLLWTFGLPEFLTLTLWAVPTWTVAVMLVRQPDGLAEMGLFAAANQWFAALLFLPRVLDQVLLPVYARRLAAADGAGAGALALASARVIALSTVPVIGLLVALSPWIAALYGPDFAAHTGVFVCLFVAAGVAAPQGVLTNYLIARERMWTRLAISAVWAALLLGGAALLIERGALGMAFATLIAYGARTLVIYAYVRRLVRR
jgi:O-antigen/teichoic acid export membrane protein